MELKDGSFKKVYKICRDNHIHYTSLRLLFEQVQELANQAVIRRSKLIIPHEHSGYDEFLPHAQKIQIKNSTNGSPPLIDACREKQAQGCIVDVIIPTILFVYFLTLPSLLHPSIPLLFCTCHRRRKQGHVLLLHRLANTEVYNHGVSSNFILNLPSIIDKSIFK